MNYQAKLSVPFGIIGIRCEGDALCGIDFLPPESPRQQPTGAFAEQVSTQIKRYFIDCESIVGLPLRLLGTPYQRRVWQAIAAIPCGKTLSYGELASELHSSAQAVGQACGANPIPIVIPCHRVVSQSGLGGFMKQRSGAALDIKRWLLVYENAP